jgi:ATP-dependent Clp protease ATP-binding subunit ClpA
MIGRQEELHRLVQLADAPETNIAVLAGEPGIGKTRLVRVAGPAAAGDDGTGGTG